MTVKGQQNRKRKLSDSPAQSKVPPKSPLSTPQNKKVNTPQPQKSAQKAQTPQQQQLKNTPKSAKNSGKKQIVKSKTPAKKESEESEEEVDSEDEAEEDAEVLQPSSKKIKLASPVKADKSASNVKVEQKTSPIKEPASNTASKITTDTERKGNYDARTLFVKNLPGNCSVKEIKALSSDIKLVRLRINMNKFNEKKNRSAYAYVEFASEEIAEKNVKVLEAASIRGKQLVVDYVGEKSKHKKEQKQTEEFDPLKLYIAGLPADATEADLRKIFPKAKEIVIPIRKKDKKAYGYGFATFATAQLAKEYHDKTQEISMKDNTLVVLYAKVRKPEEEKKSENKKEAQKKQTKTKEVKKAQPAKGKEPEKMEEDDDDDDDDDDEDDEEEGDDDEEEEDDDDDEEDDDDDEEDNDDE